MSNSFFNHLNPFTVGSLVRAEDANSKFDGVETGFTLVETELGRSLKLPAEFTGSLEIPAQSYTNKLLWLDANGDLNLRSATMADDAEAAQLAAELARDAAVAAQAAAEAARDSASSSASSATASAAGALQSETNALASANAAQTAQGLAEAAAATSLAAESNASDSEVDADASRAAAVAARDAAIAAQLAAEAARDSVLTSFENFDDKYLGAKTSDPTLDNEGQPLTPGTLYFNSVTQVMRLYTGSEWVPAYVDATGVVLVGGNVSELVNDANYLTPAPSDGSYYARRNNTWVTINNFDGSWLSLSGKPSEFTPAAHTHSVAELTDADFATSAQGAKADSAVQPNTSPTLTSPTVTNVVVGGAVKIGNWDIELDGADLRFQYGGVDKVRITTSGSIVVADDVFAASSP